MKKDVWLIRSWQLVEEKVVFEEPLTEEEALAAHKDGGWADIIDSDTIEFGAPLSAE